MFNSANIHLPMREKSHAARPQPLRGFSHQRAPQERTGIDDQYGRGSTRDMWDTHYNDYDSYSRSPFDLRDGGFGTSWRSMSPNGARSHRYASAPTTTRSGPYQQERRIGFQQATSNMITALEYASKALQTLDKTFNEQIRTLRLWLPTQHIDSLWTIYTAWNGIPATKPPNGADSLKPDTATGRSETTATTYAEIVLRISKALIGLKNCVPPEKLAGGIGNGDDAGSYFPESQRSNNVYGVNRSGHGLGWEVLRTTMRKLEISLEAIEELMGLVRAHRDRIPALRHEILAAVQLLEGMRPFFEEVPVPSKSKGKAAAKDTTTRRTEEEYEWPDCGAI